MPSGIEHRKFGISNFRREFALKTAILEASSRLGRQPMHREMHERSGVANPLKIKRPVEMHLHGGFHRRNQQADLFAILREGSRGDFQFGGSLLSPFPFIALPGWYFLPQISAI